MNNKEIKVRAYYAAGLEAQGYAHAAEAIRGGQDDVWARAAFHAINAALSEGAPEGFVLVPAEPTDAMMQAAMEREDDEPPSSWGKSVPAPHDAIYRAMLAAAKDQQP